MIIAVTNRLLCKDDFLKQIEQIAINSPHSIILREKDLSPEDYEILAYECLGICNHHNVPLIINSFIKVAQKLKIPNIHLPMDLFSKHWNELGSFQQIGVSVHSTEEAKLAQNMGATYLIAGHVFQTDCKKGVFPRGVDFLKEVCNTVTIPAFAIGGITSSNANNVLEAGADGICIMSELMTCENPENILKSYNHVFL